MITFNLLADCHMYGVSMLGASFFKESNKNKKQNCDFYKNHSTETLTRLCTRFTIKELYYKGSLEAIMLVFY